MSPPRPRARLLTPPGPAAIAVLEVEGAGAAAAIARVFRPRATRRPAGGRVVSVGTIETDEVADEVVLVPVDADRFEICGHGGPGTIARVLAALGTAGVDAAAPLPAPLVARARTWLGVRVASWVEEGRLRADDPRLGPLLEPRRVVLAGAPNAGKSSLFNALLERDRAIVSPLPGTTRDLIEEETAFEGVPVRLCDSAGVSATESAADSATDAATESTEATEVDEHAIASSSSVRSVDSVAQARSRRAAAEADLVLRCVDGSTARPFENENENENENELLVVTKADLPHAFELPPGAIRVSARTREGLEALALAVATMVLGCDPREVRRP